MPSAIERDSDEGLNVIIPIGGIGSRFSKDGYRFPKPLINIVGKPMICWLINHLSLTKNDTLWVAINEAVDEEFMFGQMLRKWNPKVDIKMVDLKFQTRGAVETLFVVTQSMPESHLNRRTISLDCDTIYFCDVLSHVRSLPSQSGACVYFEDKGIEPIFSYIKTDEHELITDIQEKKAISNKANSGAYVFPSGNRLREWAGRFLDAMLVADEERAGEYYTSQLIGTMIRAGVSFNGIRISEDDFSCVGTPRQLKQFLRRIKQENKPVPVQKRRFCFDLDLTLVGVPAVSGDYSTCPPIPRNIELVRALHAAGHHIIIQTARRMRTHNGNVGAVIADIGNTTIQSLAKYGIPYDELVFGKPWADIYVDDLAVNANLDTYRELGWEAQDELAETENHNAEVKRAKENGMVASRAFNHIQLVGEKIVKSSRSQNILGELYFYSHMPDAVADLFPKAHALEHIEETSTYSITMQKVAGTSYSQLLVGRSLTAGRLQAFLTAIHRIHKAPSSTSCQLRVPNQLQKLFNARAEKDPSHTDIYANYSSKLRARYDAYRGDYDRLGSRRTQRILSTLTQRLDLYASEHRGVFANVIHGDPVFSNAILNDISHQVAFIDVRSQQGDKLTTAGDVTYDLAKILQSLNGYDHVIMAEDDDFKGDAHFILENTVLKADRLLLKQLQDDVFWPFVEEEFGASVRKQDVLDIMASLLFSLIPLHGVERQPVFLKMCENVLEHSLACPV